MGRRRAALAGAVGAVVALGVTEVVSSALAPARPSPVDSVARLLVDPLAGPFEERAVRWFGSRDKQVLVAVIVVVVVIVGAVAAAWAGTRRRRVVGCYAGVALVGLGAVWRDVSASRGAGLVAVLAGTATGLLLTVRGGRAPAPSRSSPPRRRLLVGGALVAASGVGWSVARRIRFTGLTDRLVAGEPPTARRPAAAPPVGSSPALDGMPTYVTATPDVFRIDTAIFPPAVDVDTWRLDITGLVARPRSYTYAELLALPMTEAFVTLACVSNDVGGHLVANARWLGVPLADLLADVGLDADAEQLVGESVDGFTVNIATRDVLDGRTALVAVGMNGEWLPVEHGYPARLVVAGFYGYASATKWLRELRLTRRDDEDSYWVALDWAKDGPSQLQSRFDVPAAGARVTAAAVRFGGVAWSSGAGIAAVEVRVDDGPWRRAELAPVVSDETWVPWTLAWPDAPSGDHVAEVRAVDKAGRVQTDVPSTPKPAGASGHHFRAFTVG